MWRNVFILNYGTIWLSYGNPPRPTKVVQGETPSPEGMSDEEDHGPEQHQGLSAWVSSHVST